MSSTANASASKVLSGFSLRSDRILFGVVFALSLTVIQRLLGLARGILFCHFMTDQQLGQFSLIYSWLLTLAPLAVLGLPGTFGRFLEEYRQAGSLGDFLKIVGRISAASTLLLAAAMFLFPAYFGWQILGSSGQTDLVWISAAALICLTGFNYLVSLVESLRQIRLATLMRFVSGTGFTFVGVGVLLVVHPDWCTLAAVAAFGISSLLGALPAIWFMRRFRSEFQNEATPLQIAPLLARIGPFAIWWWLSNLLQNLYELADRYMLIHWTSADAGVNVQSIVGQYHSARVVPVMLMGLAEMVRGLLLPYLTAAWLKGDVQAVKRQLNWVIKLVALGMLITSCGMLAISHWLFETLLQGRYADGLAVLPLTMVYCIWSCLATVGQDYLWVREKGRWANLPFALGLVINLLLNAYLIPTHGLWGAVIATSLANAFVFLALYGANWWFDCRLGSSCLLAALLPCALLLPTWLACATAATAVALALGTRWYFTAEELGQLRALGRGALDRVLGRRSGPD